MLGLARGAGDRQPRGQYAEPVSSGIAVPEAPYLGGLSATGGRIIQYVKVEHLLPEDLRERLFVEE